MALFSMISSMNFDAENCLPMARQAPDARTDETEIVRALLW